MRDVLFLLTGCTAAGKEAVALRLADRFCGEIVSVDSMKVYRGMDIGSAKPSAEARRRVRHHMIDVVDPVEEFSLARYLEGAARAKADIRARHRVPIFSGGAPLYARGLLYGLFDGPAADWELRRKLMARAARDGNEALHRELGALDPAAAARIHPNDLKRVARAIEVARVTGSPISGRQTQFSGPPQPSRVAALRRGRLDLRARIEARVDRMFEAGLVEETRSLAGRMGRTARMGVGYRETLEYLDGVRDLAATRKRICQRTWRLSRKQTTWLGNFDRVDWVDVAPDESADSVADRVEALWRGDDDAGRRRTRGEAEVGPGGLEGGPAPQTPGS